MTRGPPHILRFLSVQVALSQVKMTKLDYWGPRSPLNITSGNILANFVYFVCFYTRYLISKNLRASSRRARSAKSIRSLLMALKTKHLLVNNETSLPFLDLFGETKCKWKAWKSLNFIECTWWLPWDSVWCLSRQLVCISGTPPCCNPPRG